MPAGHTIRAQERCGLPLAVAGFSRNRAGKKKLKALNSGAIHLFCAFSFMLFLLIKYALLLLLQILQ
jgi:hypothetical protein